MFEYSVRAFSALPGTSSRSQLASLFAAAPATPVGTKQAHLPAPEPMPEEDDDDDDGRKPGSGGGGNIDPEEDEGWSEDDEDDEEDAASGCCAPQYAQL